MKVFLSLPLLSLVSFGIHTDQSSVLHDPRRPIPTHPDNDRDAPSTHLQVNSSHHHLHSQPLVLRQTRPLCQVMLVLPRKPRHSQNHARRCTPRNSKPQHAALLLLLDCGLTRLPLDPGSTLSGNASVYSGLSKPS